MGKIKNYTRNEAYSRIKEDGVMGWDHDKRKRAGVGVLKADRDTSLDVPTGAYYIVVDEEGAAFGKTAKVLRDSNGKPYFTRNKDDARRRAVKWMENHP